MSNVTGSSKGSPSAIEQAAKDARACADEHKSRLNLGTANILTGAADAIDTLREQCEQYRAVIERLGSVHASTFMIQRCADGAAAAPIATVINNNQPGWTNIVETGPNVTLPVGTKLFHEGALIAVGAAIAQDIFEKESTDYDALQKRCDGFEALLLEFIDIPELEAGEPISVYTARLLESARIALRAGAKQS